MLHNTEEDAALLEKPRLLFLGHTLPYPPDGGVYIRAHNVRRLLARSFQVTTICFDRKGMTQPLRDRGAHLAALEEFGPVFAVDLPENVSRVRVLSQHVKSLLTGRVFTFYKHKSAEFEAHLDRLLQERRFDLVHIDSMDLSRYIPRLGSIPVVCTHHNIESELLRDRAETESGLRRKYVRMQAELQLKEEERWCPKVGMNVTVSDRDRGALLRIAPTSRVETIPNGVDTDVLRPDWSVKTSGVVFVGGLGWFPNRDALEYYCSEILPILREKRADIETTWVGRASKSDIEMYRDRFQVRLTGYVDSIIPFVQRASCYVIPMRVGGGTRLKLLDAWALGKAVVSTSQGVEGTVAINGQNALISDDANEFANGVLRVLEEPALREALGQRGRETVEDHYSWDVIGSSQRRLYEEVLSEAATGSGHASE